MRYDDFGSYEPPELYAPPDGPEFDESENQHPLYERIAEVIVQQRDGRTMRGSGYLVRPGRVLTCAHVIRHASSIRVRFKGDSEDEWIGEASPDFLHENTDIAILSVGYSPTCKMDPIQFGFTSIKAAILPCSAVGFPRFKMRQDVKAPTDATPPQYRDSFHLSGSAPLLSNQKEGTLEIEVSTPPAPALPEQGSPWEGMSGAAVIANNLLVGLIAKHHKDEGPGRLTAIKLDSCYERMSSVDFAFLQRLIGLPSRREALADPLSSKIKLHTTSNYLTRVKNHAPDRLVDRDVELDELVSFCAGTEEYLWIQAPPWAGKTALASWFVLDPPLGTRVASFFIATRITSEASIHPFLVRMIEQLSHIANRHPDIPLDQAGRVERFQHMIEVAARSISSGSRLILVIDGLDEDSGSRPSIASVLPRNLPTNVRIIVTGRPHPELPLDVPGMHPLRTCRKHHLEPSPYATRLEVEAEGELRLQLDDNSKNLGIVGYLAACQDGLTVRDLAELTSRQHFDIRTTVSTRFGRSLRAGFKDGIHDSYIFAHETLHHTAREMLSSDLDYYRAEINKWADTYKRKGWPEDTPRYLLSPYGRMLLDAGDVERYSELVADARRHDLMLSREKSYTDAISEIIAFQNTAVGRGLDITVLTRLAIEHARVLGRDRILNVLNRSLISRRITGMKLESRSTSRFEHASIFAKMSLLISDLDHDRAEALALEGRDLAFTLSNPICRASALVDVASALAASQAWEAALAVTEGIEDTGARARALKLVIMSLAEHGQEELALHASANIKSFSLRIEAQIGVATAIVKHSPKRALAIINRVREDEDRSKYCLRGHLFAKWEAYVLARSGQWEQAMSIAASVQEPRFQRAIVADVCSVLASSVDLKPFAQCFDRLKDPVMKDAIIADNILGLAKSGHQAYAERLISRMSDTQERSKALGCLGAKLIRQNPVKGEILLAEARNLIRGLNSAFRSPVTKEIVDVLIEEEAFALAEELIGDISDLQSHARMMGRLGARLIRQNPVKGEILLAEARNLIRGLNSAFRSPVTKEIVDVLIEEEAFVLAEELMGDIFDQEQRLSALDNLLLHISDSVHSRLRKNDNVRLVEAAYRLTADSLRHDLWPALFKVFVRLYPEAFDHLFDELKSWRIASASPTPD